jgi:hypothetical protein
VLFFLKVSLAQHICSRTFLKSELLISDLTIESNMGVAGMVEGVKCKIDLI